MVGIGVAPNTGWLEGSGLNVDDGVVTDETLVAAPGVVAAGDIARWPSARYGGLLRVEHWETPSRWARPPPAGCWPTTTGPSPSRSTPCPGSGATSTTSRSSSPVARGPDDDVEVVIGSTDERRFVALYGRAGRVVGVLGMNRPRHVMQLRALVSRADGRGPMAWPGPRRSA